MAFYRSGSFTLAYCRWLFIELAATHFREYTGFFAGALEAPQCDVERFVFFDFNVGHEVEIPCAD